MLSVICIQYMKILGIIKILVVVNCLIKDEEVNYKTSCWVNKRTSTNFCCWFRWKVRFRTEYLYGKIFNNYVILFFFCITFASLFTKVLFILNWSGWRIKTLFCFYETYILEFKKMNFPNKLFKNLSSGLFRNWLCLEIICFTDVT